MADLQKAAEILNDSGVVGLPTETVYGLAARIDRPLGIEKIFITKQRPFFDPLIVHVASVEQARTCVQEWGSVAQALADSFWPGPLTMVLEKSEQISSMITSGLSTVGLRCPDHALALELIREVDSPLAAPSANLFGRTSPTRAEHVLQEFAEQVFVLDGGVCAVGIESTILAIQGFTLKVLRPGILTVERINEALRARGIEVRWEEASGKTEAPGQMKHHYMPAKPLILIANPKQEDQLRIEIKNRIKELPPEVEGVRITKPSSVENITTFELGTNPTLAARELYQSLRLAAAGEGDVICLIWPHERREGEWVGVWDRLRKAASLILS